MILCEHAPHFPIGIRPYVGWRGLSPRSAFKIEAQPIPGDATYTTFERPDAAPLNKCSHVHVGAVHEVPDFVRWPPVQHQTMPSIVPTRQVPRFCQQATPSDSHADRLRSSCRQCRNEAVEQHVRLGGFIDQWEMPGIHDDFDPYRRDFGRQHVQIWRHLPLAH